MNDTLNTAFESNLEHNLENDFNTALELSNKNNSYETIIEQLKSNKIVEKQIAVLQLDELRSKNDAKILVSNLINQDGKIREVVAFKLNELSKNPDYFDFFCFDELYPTYLKGITDINGNICRQIVEFTNTLSKHNKFREYMCKNLPEQINTIWEEIEKLDLCAMQYVVSKRNFQLYWSLEALYNYATKIDANILNPILLKTGEFYDYTIREKTAKIVAKLDNSELNNLKEKLKNDENYYVRRYL